jgi:hypothetical protein
MKSGPILYRIALPIAAVAAISAGLAACESSRTAATRYPSTSQVVAALKHGGLACTGGDNDTPVVSGAKSETLCNFTSSEQVLIDVFPGTVSTATVLRNSVSTGTEQIWSDVGPNWWVQTSHAYVKRVQTILGGRIVAGPWHQQATSSQATPSSVSCDDQVVTWADNGGASQDQTVSNDISNLQTAISDATSATDPGIISAAATLAADAKTAAQNSPPKCTGLYYRYLVGMAALALGSTDVEYGSDTNGTALLTKGQNKLQPVLTEINSDYGAGD